MRAAMGLLKDRHGTYYARKRVPPQLQEAVAQVLGNGKAKQAWLKKSLGTKALREANIRVKIVQMEFDRTLAQAEDLLKARPVRTSLSNAEIKRMADYVYQQMLAADDEFIRDAPIIEEEHRKLAGENDGPQEWNEQVPEFGLSGGQLLDFAENVPGILNEAKAALGRGDIQLAVHKIKDAVVAFQINLDPNSEGYRKLGIEILRAYVRGLEAIVARRRGEPIETPAPTFSAPTSAVIRGGTLRDALEGWKKERSPSRGVLREYERAIRLFGELHGDLPVVQIKRGQARSFREALQDLPRHRSAKLLHAPLPELAEWGRKHPEAPKITAATVNKLLGGVQTIGLWARDKGLIPDEIPWADPFTKMRLAEDMPERDAFTVAELNALFASAVFAKGERPQPGRGEAAFWLPLLGLYTGARRGELAALAVKDVYKIDDVYSFAFVEERAVGKTLKTRASARTVPVHPQLIKLGWLKYVDRLRHSGGEKAWLFPQIAPSKSSALKAWSKWFNRYLRAIGIGDRRKVFHSFRHTFKDALRTASVPEDLNDALMGHSNASVGRGYGAKEIVRRFGMPTLEDAIKRVNYKGLDLNKVRLIPHRNKRV